MDTKTDDAIYKNSSKYSLDKSKLRESSEKAEKVVKLPKKPITKNIL